MDTNPTSSGTGDLAASLIASVGGQQLTLTANLTSNGEAIVGKATEANTIRLRAAFATLTSERLANFTALVLRVRQGFATLSACTTAQG